MIRLAPLLLLLLSGCIVRTAADIATAPVRATGWTYDRLTTSQAEADRNRGRRDRKDAKKREKAQRKAARDAARRQSQAPEPSAP